MKNIENIEQILRELKFIDPNINEKDEKLKLIVSRMLEIKPQIEDKTFKANLKKEIMKEIALRNKKAFNFFPFKTLGFLLSGLAFSYAVFITVNPSEPINNIKNLTNTGTVSTGSELSLKTMINDSESQDVNTKITSKSQKISEAKITAKTPAINPKIDNTSNESSTPNQDLAMSKKIPDTTSSDSSASLKSTQTTESGDTFSDASISGAEDIGMTSDISADRMMPTMSITALPPQKEFNQKEFVDYLSNSYSGALISVLKSSEMKLENDILTINVISKEDFDIINIPENIKIIKGNMSDYYGFYGEIKVNY